MISCCGVGFGIWWLVGRLLVGFGCCRLVVVGCRICRLLGGSLGCMWRGSFVLLRWCFRVDVCTGGGFGFGDLVVVWVCCFSFVLGVIGWDLV